MNGGVTYQHTEIREIEVMEVLHMNGGVGDTSYANNSLLQREMIAMTRSIMKEAITALYLSISPRPSTLMVADLGCSSGPNTLFAVSEIITNFESLWKEMGHYEPLEYQVFLNDLPGNDFNTLFRALQSFQEKNGRCYFVGVPGSFYDRLFPEKTLHIVHSSSGVHWLSRVPECLEGNQGNMIIGGASPRCVVDAYYQQFRNDFSTFLKHRAQELVSGGVMVLTMLTRRSEDSSCEKCCCILELLAVPLNEMVLEGLIEEEKLDAFNIPFYKPSPSELKAEVLKEGSFSINRLEVSEVNWSGKQYSRPSSNGGHRAEACSIARCVRAVAEPMLVNHFGHGIIEDVFRRYSLLIEDRIAKDTAKLIMIGVSLTRKPI